MKVAICYDWLNSRFGGGERTLLEIAQLYPDAPIYTLLYDQERFGDVLPSERIRTSRLQKLPSFLRNRSRYLAQFIPGAIAAWDFSEYDLVISVSSAWVKNITVPDKTQHICYCFSPMRFAWDHWPAYLDEQQVGPLRRFYIRWLVSKLRVWDYYGSKGVNTWFAISKTAAIRIKKYYNADAKIIFPPVETESFKAFPGRPRKDYFLTLASLTPYKKLDVAIAAAKLAGVNLIVASDGPDRARLENLADNSVTFTGYVGDDERLKLVGEAQALLFPQEEDFGISPVEAMAAGTPVIAYGKGGAAETVIDGKTGILYTPGDAESLATAIRNFRAKDYDAKTLAAHAKAFDASHFRAQFSEAIKKATDKAKHHGK